MDQPTSVETNELTSSTNLQLFSLVRAALALCGLVLVGLDPARPERWPFLTYLSLSTYTLYGLAILHVVNSRGWTIPAWLLYWPDAFFATVIVSVTDGALSSLWFFFFFPIIAGSFTGGFERGLRMTLLCALLFVLVGALVTPHAIATDFERTLMRPLSLLGLGFMIAWWGGSQIELRRKIAFVGDLTRTFTVRVNRQQLMSLNLARLRAFFDADECILVCCSGAKSSRFLIESRKQAGSDMAEIHLDLPEPTFRQLMVLGTASGRYVGRRFQDIYAVREPSSMFSAKSPCHPDAAAIANLLEAQTFLTVPYAEGNGNQGRVFVTWGSRKRLHTTDVQFLACWSSAFGWVLDNIALHEELVTEAAELERLATSLDLHDEVVQPYIALKMALEGLANEMSADHRSASRLREIIEMADGTLRDIRRVAADTRTGSLSATHSLRKALRLQVERYRRFFGMDIELRCPDAPRLPRSAAIVAFRIVSEALSNILRHTKSRKVLVVLRVIEGNVVLEISNQLGPGENPPAFEPRSISERVRERGGVLHVAPNDGGYTIIRATFPTVSGTRSM